MSGNATFAAASGRLATAATKMSAPSAKPARGGEVPAGSSAGGAPGFPPSAIGSLLRRWAAVLEADRERARAPIRPSAAAAVDLGGPSQDAGRTRFGFGRRRRVRTPL